MHIDAITIVLRILGALLCGAILGLERERLERAAGLRTHALVAVSSCLVMIVSAYGFADVVDSGHAALDPSRVAAQVVSGIGFLGAGVIIFRKNTISV
jgi:putative Mg2+ transporter-C (MgtC) family protein